MGEKTKRWDWEDPECLTALHAALKRSVSMPAAAYMLDKQFLPSNEKFESIGANVVSGGVRRDSVRKQFLTLFPGDERLLDKFSRQGPGPQGPMLPNVAGDDIVSELFADPGFPDSMLAEGAASAAVLKLERGACRYPIGDPQDKGFHFCGNAAARGKSYCDKHSGKARGSEDEFQATLASIA